MKYQHAILKYSGAVLVVSLSAGAFAQERQEEDNAAPPRAAESNVIVVTGTRLRGSVETDVQPIEELQEDEINALGASSIADVLSAISPQTSSGRGRGGGRPIVLLNGQRVSGFRELRNIPPEAILRVQVFPEEVALQYGFRPDQRVINFILRDRFASASAEVEMGSPQDGGYTTNEIEGTFTTIGKSTRLNLNAEYNRSGLLTQDERDIVSDSNDDQFDFDGNINEFRSLRAATEQFDLNATFNKQLAPQTNISVNANYVVADSTSLLGLPFATLNLPGSSPFSQTGQDVAISRYFASPRALERNTQTKTANFGLTFNTLLGVWRWTLTGDYGNIDSSSLTNRNADFTGLQAALDAGTADPFAAGFGDDLLFRAPDVSESVSKNLALRNSFSGTLFELPSGPVRVTFGANYNRQALDSRSVRSGVEAVSDLRRNSFSGSANIEIPIVDRDLGPLGFLGEVALNGNIGITDVSDFGNLLDYTAGIRWSPTRDLTFSASLIGDENAPSVSQLGTPILTTPNATFFDFTRNETVLIDRITGGNPLLVAEKRRDLKLGVNWSPAKIDRLNFQVEYFRNRSRNTTASFPLLTPEIEAAFTGRVVRDGSGQLISVDQRAVNYAEENSQRIRWGFNFSGRIGAQPPRGGRPGRRGPPGTRGGSRPANETGGPPGPGARTRSPNARPPGARPAGSPRAGRGGGRRGGFGRRRGGRWQIALYHSYQIEDEILIAPGIPTLDLFNGSATSNLGGTPRHRIELSGGIFNNGMGMRVSGNYRSATRADGDGTLGSSDLFFSDLTSINLRFFLLMDQRGNLTKKIPLLKGSRIALRINNVLNNIVDVRDQNGDVPLSYQPGFIDPVGRYVEISFRKRF